MQTGHLKLNFMTAHPSSVGESYLEHLAFAVRFGATMIVGGAACVVHGLLPFLCTSSASRRVRRLHAILNAKPARRETQDALVINWVI
jgi:hypothetical protein